MRGERMPHRVACGALGDGGFADRVLELPLHGGFVEVVTGDAARAWMGTEGGGSEKVLPNPLAGGVGPFPQQGFRHVDVARAADEVLEVFFAEAVKVLLEALFEGSGQGDDAMSAALAIVDGDGALAEIEVFDAEAEGFHDPQAAAIHELGDEFPGIFQAGEDGTDFLAGHDDGRAALAAGGGDVIESKFLDAKHVFHEEGHGIERLLLGARSDVALEREEVEICGDGGRADGLGGLAEHTEAEADEAAVPVNVSLLGGDRLVLDADDAAEGINEAREFCHGVGGLFRRGCRGWRGTDADGFTGEGAVVRLQGSGLIGKPLPIE